MFSFLKQVWSRFSANDRGHVAIITAAAAPALIASIGLGTEVGYWYYKERTAQKAADIGAFTGAMEARSNSTISQIRTNAISDATIGGYDPSRGSINVNWPPSSGTNQNLRSVEVIVSQSYPRLFSGVFYDGDITFTRRAVASFRAPGPACILSLHPSGSESLRFSGSSTASLTDCELMANSIARDALAVEGSGNVTVTCANSVGGASITADLTLTDCPEVRLDMPPALDPYETLPFPASTNPCRTVPPGGAPGTVKVLQPGTYCSGAILNSGDFELVAGGEYIFEGDLRINAGANVVGDGVTIFMTNDAELVMNGLADVDLSAPSSGTYEGVLFFGDPNNAEDTRSLFNGTANSSLKGALYFPNQTIDFLGDFGSSNGCTRLIGLNVDVSGNTNFDSNCSEAGVTTVNVPGAVLLME